LLQTNNGSDMLSAVHYQVII